MVARSGLRTGRKTHRDVIVWQASMQLLVEAYRVARQLPEIERFGLGAQLRRAAVSVPRTSQRASGAPLAETTYTTSRSRLDHFANSRRTSRRSPCSRICRGVRLKRRRKRVVEPHFSCVACSEAWLPGSAALFQRPQRSFSALGSPAPPALFPRLPGSSTPPDQPPASRSAPGRASRIRSSFLPHGRTGSSAARRHARRRCRP